MRNKEHTTRQMSINRNWFLLRSSWNTNSNMCHVVPMFTRTNKLVCFVHHNEILSPYWLYATKIARITIKMTFGRCCRAVHHPPISPVQRMVTALLWCRLAKYYLDSSCEKERLQPTQIPPNDQKTVAKLPLRAARTSNWIVPYCTRTVIFLVRLNGN